MDTCIMKGDFVKKEHFDNIHRWTLQQCISFLGLSEATQAKLNGSKPAAAKIAVDKRLQELIDSASPAVHISADDHYLIVNTFNTMKFILDSLIPGCSVPLISHGTFPTITDELTELYRYSLSVSSYLDNDSASKAAADSLQKSDNSNLQTTDQPPP